jgi:hypothetical protein
VLSLLCRRNACGRHRITPISQLQPAEFSTIIGRNIEIEVGDREIIDKRDLKPEALTPDRNHQPLPCAAQRRRRTVDRS